MSLYWFLRELFDDIKNNIYKTFVWKTTAPQSEIEKHPNPHLIFWIGFGLILYSYAKHQMTTYYGIILMAIWLLLCLLLKRYWSGRWRSFKKRMEGKT